MRNLIKPTMIGLMGLTIVMAIGPFQKTNDNHFFGFRSPAASSSSFIPETSYNDITLGKINRNVEDVKKYLLKERSELQKSITSLKTNLQDFAASKNKVKKLSARLTKSNQSNVKLKAQLNREIINRNKLAKENKRLARIAANIITTRSENNSLKGQLSAKKSEITGLKEVNGKLVIELGENKNEVIELKLKKEELISEISLKENKITKLQKKIVDLGNDLANDQAIIADLLDKMNVLNELVSELSDSELSKQITELESLTLNLKAKISKANTEKQKIEKENNDLRTCFKEKQKDFDELEQKVEKLESFFQMASTKLWPSINPMARMLNPLPMMMNNTSMLDNSNMASMMNMMSMTNTKPTYNNTYQGQQYGDYLSRLMSESNQAFYTLGSKYQAPNIYNAPVSFYNNTPFTGPQRLNGTNGPFQFSSQNYFPGQNNYSSQNYFPGQNNYSSQNYFPGQNNFRYTGTTAGGPIFNNGIPQVTQPVIIR